MGWGIESEKEMVVHNTPREHEAKDMKARWMVVLEMIGEMLLAWIVLT